jgi:hypothetical protein
VTSMPAGIVIRRAKPSENDSVDALVQAIADETFAYLFAPCQVPIGEANWLSAGLALSGEEIVGCGFRKFWHANSGNSGTFCCTWQDAF